MKPWLLGLALSLLVGCHATDASCCSNADCPGNYVCSKVCSGTDETKGICLAPCMVDKDCGGGAVCNLFSLSCGCQEIVDAGQSDAGVVGTCAGGVGD